MEAETERLNKLIDTRELSFDCDSKNEQRFAIVSDARVSFGRVPLNSFTELDGIRQFYLSGFSSSRSLEALRTKLEQFVYQELSEKEKEEYQKEQQELKEFRADTVKRILNGSIAPGRRRPEAPVTKRLESLVYQMEVAMTKKVVDQMSALSKRFLEVEFQLLEKNRRKELTVPSKEAETTQAISNFYARLEAVASLAIAEHESNSRKPLRSAS